MKSSSDPGTDRITVILSGAAPERLDKALARDVPVQSGLSRSRLAKLIVEGGVSRDGVPLTSPREKVQPGDEITLEFAPPQEVALQAEAIPLVVVHEDADLIVIDKPAGMVVHPAPGSRSGTLVNALMHHCGDSLSGIGGERRPGIVHRIDKDTSGLLVAAKSDRAHTGLAAQFAAHSVIRAYTAFCHGVPDPADPRLVGQPSVSFEPGGILKIDAPLGRHRADRQKQAVVQGGRHAVTRARVDAIHGTPPVVARLTCWLETGRTHQIRVHLATIGHGLLGDPVYGGARKLPKSLPEAARLAVEGFGRQALHATTLGFVHPVSGETLHFSSPLPADMQALEAVFGPVS